MRITLVAMTPGFRSAARDQQAEMVEFAQPSVGRT